MGLWHLVFTVLAFNGPLAIVVGFIPLVIGLGNGLGAPVAYIAAGVLVWVFAAGFNKMAHHLQNPGGFYAFITAGLGRPAGLGASFLALICYYFILIASYAFNGVLLEGLIRDTIHGPDIPWWIWMVALMGITAILGYLRLDLSARILTYLLVGEIVITAIYAACVTVKGGATGLSFTSFLPDNVASGAIGLALMFAVMNFGGFEATAVYREEVRDPDRTIPRAANVFIVGVTIFLAASAWVIIQAIGPDDAVAASMADPTGVVPATIGEFVGRWAQYAVAVLVNTSVFAAILSGHNITARYVYSLSVDGILPQRLSVVHHRHGSPHRSSVAVTVACVVGLAPFVVLDASPDILYAKLSGIFGYAYLLLLLLTSVAVFVWLRRISLPGVTLWHSTIAPTLSFAGLLGVVLLATANFALLLGSSEGFADAALGSIYLVGIAGVGLALLLRKYRPLVYKRIGRQ